MRGGEDHRTVDSRGNSRTRRARRLFMIERFGYCYGGIRWIKCFHCPQRFRADSKLWQVDRYPKPGHLGGRYTRDNVVPACHRCNGGQSWRQS